jgi:hypothetical protein
MPPPVTNIGLLSGKDAGGHNKARGHGAGDEGERAVIVL